ncbi:hypothetical protein D3880_20980 [Pseudomonas cavernae]|uniref:Uncharacterized protein n=1 Tax=Pseudomonas cavernae TaxID=2320867 RepID=A0A385Z616_9PSED|nr:hypothetical protein D3880_20980 [Pseudomonas cavernae]
MLTVSTWSTIKTWSGATASRLAGDQQLSACMLASRWSPNEEPVMPSRHAQPAYQDTITDLFVRLGAPFHKSISPLRS